MGASDAITSPDSRALALSTTGVGVGPASTKPALEHMKLIRSSGDPDCRMNAAAVRVWWFPGSHHTQTPHFCIVRRSSLAGPRTNSFLRIKDPVGSHGEPKALRLSSSVERWRLSPVTSETLWQSCRRGHHISRKESVLLSPFSRLVQTCSSFLILRHGTGKRPGPVERLS